jgi:hypothetical protein
MVASCRSLGGYRGPSGSGESWFEPRRGDAHRNNGGLFSGARPGGFRIAERLGEREKATESYEFVTEVWHRADPELEPYVTEARVGLERLTRKE